MVCLGVEDGLHEDARLARFKGTNYGIHGLYHHTDVASLFSGLIFTQANAPKLGIDEDGVGDKAILRAGAAMFKQVGAQNAEVIVRGVRESWPTFDITQRVDTRNVRFQLPIDLDVALFSQGDASSFWAESFSVGDTTACRQQM